MKVHVPILKSRKVSLMSSSENQTKMTNPPTSQTKMVAIKAIHPIRVGKGEDERVVSPGQVAQVTEAEAHEFCDKKIDLGYKNVFGNRHPSDIQKMIVTRAERVK